MNPCRLCGGAVAGDRLVLDPAPAAAQAFRAREDEARAERVALTIGQCGGCGLVQSLSPAVPYFERVITAAGFSPAMRAHRLDQARAFAAHFGLAGRPVVEVGCGGGYFLDILAEAGMAPTGTESGGSASARPVLDLYPRPGTPFPGAPFAAFFCLNFLEHAPDPRGFLGAVRENLAPDGVGLVEVPSFAHQRRLGRVFDYVADHVSYFDPETLATALALSGFTVERLVETRGGENLEAWVRRRPAEPLGSQAEAVRGVQAAVAAFLAGRPGRSAVWGASHQALTLLAPLAPGAVEAVFDSAPFKQGLHAPASGLPIAKPTPEAVAPLSTVLILASGYEPEIAGQLRSLGFRGEVFTLAGGAPARMDA